MQKWHWQKCNNSITAQKVLGCVIFYFYVIPFNNAIAAVCPIEVHDSQPMFWNYWGLHEPLDCPGSNIKECHNSFSLWHCTELNSTTCSNFWEKAIKGRVTWKDKRTELLEQKLTRKWAGLFTTVFPPPSWLTAQIVFWSSDLFHSDQLSITRTLLYSHHFITRLFGLFFLSVTHDFSLISHDSLLDMAVAEWPQWVKWPLSIGCLYCQSSVRREQEHSSCRWWKKRESFQDGGVDLPVRWKTIETTQRDRVSPI